MCAIRCCPFNLFNGGAALSSRTNEFEVPPHPPTVYFLGFRVLPPNPPSKGGFCLCADARLAIANSWHSRSMPLFHGRLTKRVHGALAMRHASSVHIDSRILRGMCCPFALPGRRRAKRSETRLCERAEQKLRFWRGVLTFPHILWEITRSGIQLRVSPWGPYFSYGITAASGLIRGSGRNTRS